MGRLGRFLLGLAGPAVAYASVAASVAASPWFSWASNALSDLGHSARSPVAPVFNAGLILGGALTLAYAARYMAPEAPAGGTALALTSVLMQMVGGFDEAYGTLHLYVSLAFFGAGLVAPMVHALETSRPRGALYAMLALIPWMLYPSLPVGIAVPELLSTLPVAAWVVDHSLTGLGSHIDIPQRYIRVR